MGRSTRPEEEATTRGATGGKCLILRQFYFGDGSPAIPYRWS